MFQGSRGLRLTLLAAAAVIAAAYTFGFQGPRDDTDTARAFLTHLAAGERDAAHALLHPSIAERQSAADIAAMFTGMAAYTQITFPSINEEASNGTRSTQLSGTGITAGGCTSALSFAFLDGTITDFAVEPICRADTPDA